MVLVHVKNPCQHVEAVKKVPAQVEVVSDPVDVKTPCQHVEVVKTVQVVSQQVAERLQVDVKSPCQHVEVVQISIVVPHMKKVAVSLGQVWATVQPFVAVVARPVLVPAVSAD